MVLFRRMEFFRHPVDSVTDKQIAPAFEQQYQSYTETSNAG